MKTIRTNRSLIVYILLTAVTAGIYGLWFIHQYAKDMNTMCEGDGKKTRGLLGLILLSVVTCGIYPIIYYYGICERLNANCLKNSIPCSVNGGKYILFMFLSSVTCGITGLVIMHNMFKATNALAADYNARQIAA